MGKDVGINLLKDGRALLHMPDARHPQPMPWMSPSLSSAYVCGIGSTKTIFTPPSCDVNSLPDGGTKARAVLRRRRSSCIFLLDLSATLRLLVSLKTRTLRTTRSLCCSALEKEGGWATWFLVAVSILSRPRRLAPNRMAPSRFCLCLARIACASDGQESRGRRKVARETEHLILDWRRARCE